MCNLHTEKAKQIRTIRRDSAKKEAQMVALAQKQRSLRAIVSSYLNKKVNLTVPIRNIMNERVNGEQSDEAEKFLSESLDVLTAVFSFFGKNIYI